MILPVDRRGHFYDTETNQFLEANQNNYILDIDAKVSKNCKSLMYQSQYVDSPCIIFGMDESSLINIPSVSNKAIEACTPISRFQVVLNIIGFIYNSDKPFRTNLIVPSCGKDRACRFMFAQCLQYIYYKSKGKNDIPKPFFELDGRDYINIDSFEFEVYNTPSLIIQDTFMKYGDVSYILFTDGYSTISVLDGAFDFDSKSFDKDLVKFKIAYKTEATITEFGYIRPESDLVTLNATYGRYDLVNCHVVELIVGNASDVFFDCGITGTVVLCGGMKLLNRANLFKRRLGKPSVIIPSEFVDSFIDYVEHNKFSSLLLAFKYRFGGLTQLQCDRIVNILQSCLDDVVSNQNYNWVYTFYNNLSNIDKFGSFDKELKGYVSPFYLVITDGLFTQSPDIEFDYALSIGNDMFGGLTLAELCSILAKSGEYCDNIIDDDFLSKTELYYKDSSILYRDFIPVINKALNKLVYIFQEKLKEQGRSFKVVRVESTPRDSYFLSLTNPDDYCTYNIKQILNILGEE